MKISKLFHWLYALVMLLPIFAIGVTSLVSTFNMSAKQETEITYKYQTNEVNTSEDVIKGNIYHMKLNRNTLNNLLYDYQSSYIQLGIIKLDKFSVLDYNRLYFDEVYFDVIDGYPSIIITTGDIQFHSPDNDSYITVYMDLGQNGFVNLDIEGDFLLLELESEDVFSNEDLFNICNDIPIENVVTHNLDTQDIFYNAVDKVQESALFNWAYDSFLVAPFAYIVSLFSMPTNSVVVMLLSYWLAISIIWLVFDLVMYVPLLVHRWLDKGVLE